MRHTAKPSPSAPDSVRGDTPFPLGPALDFMRRIWRLDHTLGRLSSQMERDLGVTAQQRLILRCVGKYPGITASRLADLLHVDPGTMSAALRRLEQKRLLARRRDPSDGRKFSLGLTPQGRSLNAPTSVTLEAAVDELLSTSKPAETAAAIAVVERLVRILERDLG